ncbi:MAG: hypothetical protein LBU30_03775 [Candidatus Methanoplasma sp.]|jgi:hypothetical protein|nr:hypothetical protein [Candidatus Methanoplasma sp.]
METYHITNQELIELKQTMGFRVTDLHWNELVKSHPEGCTNTELIAFVKKWMDPPYKVEGDLDAHLENILKSFVSFVRG